MFRYTRYIAAIIFSLLFASEAQSASQFINCPATEIETGVSSRITSPWWSTPRTGRLMDIDVMRVGGNMTLSCIYDGGPREVPIMRRFPPGYARCTADGGGFRCTKSGNTLTVDCPARQVVLDVTSSVTSPWWSTEVTGTVKDVEVMTIGGQPALACLYVGRSGEGVPVMRRSPSGYDSCREGKGGFDCTKASTNTKENYGGKAVGKPGNKYTESVKTNEISKSVQAKEIPASKSSSDKAVGKTGNKYTKSVMTNEISKSMQAKEIPVSKSSSGKVCTDLKVGDINVTNISQYSGDYNFTLVSKLNNNSGYDWVSSSGQQSVYIYKNKEVLRKVPFTNLRNGDEEEMTLNIRGWGLDRPGQPKYSFRLMYDPDIKNDSNNKNDDCNSKNNLKTITGAEINRKLRETGK